MDLNLDNAINSDRSRVEDDRELDTEVEDRSSPSRTPLTVRESLKQSFRDARRDEEPDEVEETEPLAGKEREVAAGGVGEDEEPAETEAAAEGEETERATPRAKPAEAAPAAWDKTAKAEWANLPDKVKAAVTKREKDVEKGVEHLKQQVHQRYGEIDEAIAPYEQVIRQFNKTPGQAVAQLFAWFDALAKNPDQAFPALLQSYKYDIRRILPAYGINVPQQQQQQTQPQNGQQPPQGTQQPPGEISPAVQAYINKLEQRLNGFESQVGQQFNGLAQHFSEQSAAKTQEMLDRWAADKPYFNDVRVMMGHLLTPDPNTGQAAIPLKDGKVDLDAAYDAAVYAHPDIRSQIIADQQAKAEAARLAKQAENLKIQQEKAAKARRAAGSLITSAPGAEISRKGTPSKGLSVRDSLKAAISELSDR